MKRFLFNFHHEDNGGGDGVVHFFEIVPKADDPQCHCSENQEWLDFVGGTMEFYGVHDFCTSGDDELIGYHSYEIKLSDQETVVKMWHEFLAENGFQPGEIQVLEYDAYLTKFGMQHPYMAVETCVP